MTLAEWKFAQLADITRQADEYRRKRKLPERPTLGKAPRGVQKRHSGETALYDGYGWLYAPQGLAADTWEQIYEETEHKKCRIQVIRWPEGEIVFDSLITDLGERDG